MSDPTTDPDEQPRPIAFTYEDRELILKLYSIDAETENRFKLAMVAGNKLVVQMNAYDLDELLGAIAAVANHEKNSKQRNKLDALFKRVSDKLEKEFPQ